MALTQVHNLSKAFTALKTNVIELQSILLFLHECEKTLESAGQGCVPNATSDDRICDVSLQISCGKSTQRWIEGYERRVQNQLSLVRTDHENTRSNLLTLRDSYSMQ